MFLEMLSKDEDLSHFSKAEVLYTNLKRDILMSNLRNGTKITEEFVCQKYNVSRTPARSAIQMLEGDGLVEIILNRGAFVRNLSSQAKIDIYNLAIVNELLCVDWLIDRITKEEEEELKKIFEYMEFYTLKNQYNILKKANSAFHLLIHHSCHNHFLERKLNSYSSTLEFSSPRVSHLPTLPAILLEEHREIYNALLAKDKTSAKRAMHIHILNTYYRSYNTPLESIYAGIDWLE